MSANQRYQPFIKWIGGKRKIIDKLSELVPSGLNNYYEPFLGGGALFFHIQHKFNKSFLSDINLDLVISYNGVKKTPNEICKLLNIHTENHSKEYYYQVQNLNNSNNPSAISARFLYLNRHAFRGIYKLNKNGKNNVACDSKTYKTSKMEDRIKLSSLVLKNAVIYASDFSFIEPSINDFVYFDPPYYNSGEKFYTRLPFDESEQIRLKDFVEELTVKGVKLMLSNSYNDFIMNLYRNYNIKILEVRYDITNYKEVKKEVLITNY